MLEATPPMIPADWMPDCLMERIIVHWTAGGPKASDVDKEHYHILIEQDGSLVRGDHPISDNVSTGDGDYAAHTKNCNTGSIGVALCGMSGAIESPFQTGPYPLTMAQVYAVAQVCAELCRAYAISVGPTTVLSHAEVQDNLGVAQDGKWDISFPPYTAKQVGDKLRADIGALI